MKPIVIAIITNTDDNTTVKIINDAPDAIIIGLGGVVGRGL
jgi:hypothetical protein